MMLNWTLAYNMKHDDDAAFAELVLKDALFQALFGDASNMVLTNGEAN